MRFRNFLASVSFRAAFARSPPFSGSTFPDLLSWPQAAPSGVAAVGALRIAIQ